MRRMIEPKEVAAAILFLAFTAASPITAAIRPVDAGTPLIEPALFQERSNSFTWAGVPLGLTVRML